MSSILYPPILERSAPAFDKDIKNYKISFQLPSFLGYSDIGHIQIKVSSQNGELIGNPDKYPDGVIYKDITDISQTDNSITLNCANDLHNGSWTAGLIYKIQMRLGDKRFNPDSSSESDFNKWKSTIGNISEWSNIMITKALAAPRVQIANGNNSIETTDTPVFLGLVSMPEINNEIVDKIKYDIYEGEKLLESSGWLVHTNINSEYRFKHKLDVAKNYSTFLSIHTLNNYEQTSAPYEFKIVKTSLNELNGVFFFADAAHLSCRESGHIKLFLTSEQFESGSFIISRASEKDNYLIWEDIEFLQYSKGIQFNNTLIYQDFLIESGVKYKYAIQKERAGGIRTKSIETEAVSVDYENTFLSDGIHQLNLMYDTKLSSFKKTVLASKQDSLGSSYPIIMRNGAAYYAEFPITGLISLNQDLEETTFLKKEIVYDKETQKPLKFKYYYDDELLFTLDEEYILNLSRDRQVYLEKLFRDKVEKFLNNGGYKIYRSSTEGNFIITLMNVSLTPKENLGRMVYSFSATAYEIAAFDIKFLQEMKATKDDTSKKDEVITKEFFGQLVNPSEDILSKIQDEIAVSPLPEGFEDYEYKLLEITSIRVEGNGIDTLTIQINDKDILLPPNRIYTLTSQDAKIDNARITNGQDGSAIAYSYTVKLIPKENIETSKIVFVQEWGQIAKIWNEDLDIIKAIKEQIFDNVKGKYGEQIEISIDGFNYLKLEGEERTFLIANNEKIMIGPTGIYQLADSDALNLKTLSLEAPSYLMVDYICVAEVLIGG